MGGPVPEGRQRCRGLGTYELFQEDISEETGVPFADGEDCQRDAFRRLQSLDCLGERRGDDILEPAHGDALCPSMGVGMLRVGEQETDLLGDVTDVAGRADLAVDVKGVDERGRHKRVIGVHLVKKLGHRSSGGCGGRAADAGKHAESSESQMVGTRCPGQREDFRRQRRRLSIVGIPQQGAQQDH
ncbi:hypothetical protein ACWCV5_34550 [Streptomyces tubercidicus]